MTLTPSMAARELLRRRAARSSLVEYARYIDVPGAPIIDDDECETFETVNTELAKHHVLILEATERCIQRHRGRTMLFLPPGSAKSTYATVVAPTYFMGKIPEFKVIGVSYGSDLSRKFGRRMRSIARQSKFSALFSATLATDSKAADEWAISNGSEFMGGGILSGITGNRADFIPIDDPIKGRREADSEATRSTTLSAYQEDVLTRLKPSGSLMITQCLTGDAMVAMADGNIKRMDAVNVGDLVTSWDGIEYVGAVVDAVVDSGEDQTYLIRTNGTEIRANARHPFLVLSEKGLQWIRVRQLRRGMNIVTHREALERVHYARLQIAESRLNVVGCAPLTMGSQTSFPIITTKQGMFAACYATTATELQDELEMPQFWNVPSNTSEPDIEEVLSVEPYAIERVYDLSVKDTHNFVANGLCTHNTRWHADDLAGSILPEDWDGESGMIKCRDGETWEVVCIPAQCTKRDDPIRRKIGEYIWPEYFGPEHWEPFKKNSRTWSALFQQQPSPDEGTFFLKEWFNRFDTAPPYLNYYMTSDHAPGGNQDNDYNVFRVWGIDPQQHIWLVDGYRVQGTIDKAMGVALSPSGDMSVALQGALPLIRKWKPFCWFPEDDNNWKAVKPFVVAAMRKTGTHCRIEAISPHGADKATKAQPFQAKAAMGEVHIKSGPDFDSVIDQYVKFPTGKHDDEVDAAANMGRAIDMAHPALVPPEKVTGVHPGDYRPKAQPQGKGFWA
jgi:hypothetical protein